MSHRGSCGSMCVMAAQKDTRFLHRRLLGPGKALLTGMDGWLGHRPHPPPPTPGR